ELGGDRFETRHRRKDGTIIDLEVSTQYQPFGGGRTIAFLRDITEQHRAAEALRASESFIKTVMDNLPIGIAVNSVDPSVSFHYMNDNFPAFYRTSRAALTSTDAFWEAVYEDPAFRAEMKERVLDDCASGDPARMHWVDVPITRNGERTTYIEARNIPVPEQKLMISTVWDVTGRKEAEKGQEQFFRFFQTSADLMCLADPHGCFLKTNRAFTETLGYSEEELLSRPFLEFIHPDDQQTTLDELVVQLQRGYTNNFHNRYLCKDGSVKWLSWRVSFDKDDGIAYATARDVTAKKKMETALRENEERMTLALQAGNMGLYDLDVQSGKAVVNAEYALMLGYDPSDFYETNEKWIERLHPEDREPVAAVYQAYVRGEIPEYKVEFRQKTRDGKWKWILSYGRIMKRAVDGTPLRMLGVHVDISERKEAEEALREGKEQLRVIFDASQAGIILVSPQGEILFANSRMAELFGMPLEKLIGSSYAEHLHPSEAKAGDERMQQLIRGEIQSVANERHYRRADGTDFWGFLSGKRLENPDGSLRALVGIIADLTEQRRLQEQLSQAHKIESVGRLAGGVAHDFNNMLGVIIGHAQLARMKETLSPRMAEHLEQIEEAAERSSDIARQLLAFARKQTATPLILDLNETVAGMLKILTRLIGENIDLAWFPAESLWRVKMAPAQIDQILANLCINARDAIVGTGRISIETRNQMIDATFAARHTGLVAGDYVLLTVSDNGCGMEKETIRNIFEPFFTTKEVGKGTGLGLATVYGIVKQNDGFIDVYSEAGQGTTFKIYLPRYREGGEESPASESLMPAERGQETILLVEDEPGILALGKELLETQGYNVLAAATPGEAIRLATEYRGKIHLLLTDVIMPEMNGRDLAGKLLSLHPALKRLFMSGYTADIIAHHGVLDEGVHFIQKPFSFANLTAKVREALDS
ncbi:MAG: PAS domain S-box protein, partial [Desulfuromonadales bacterium]|nr:PAS domain S-box protein [Desulfuromonadales bacterium]